MRRFVSIPFIAGQWSLRKEIEAREAADRFQSPSLRGSGRFNFAVFRWVSFEDRVSIPFIAGQWSLQ